jgi:hypothetical protein
MPTEHRTIVYRDEVYQLPFADLLRPLTADERRGMQDSIKAHDVIEPVVLFESTCWGVRCVLDGANRLTLAAACDADVPFVDMGPMGEKAARELAISLNADRRHLSPEEQVAARTERVERVKKARKEGASLRVIAEKEGVSEVQVRRDLKGESGAPPGAPDDEPDPEPEVVVTHAGADKAAAAVDVIVRSLKRSKAMLSGLMTGPYAQLLKNVSESVTHCKLYATGEMLSKGEWGSITYGIGEYSTPAIDEMLTLCGGMKLALSRAEAVAVEMEATATPGEAWQLGQDLGEDDDRITF